eukprot:TRINITY_DN111049_c0_g1_i1.p1 TRINITY_DN111049_c0_g1~~TRINITY_DN111049_c0_g1_i1.p1  ORF type:complete len:294 (+),score=54.99 TRINITY_DN111049_c0_g1_i1:28-882(+)
MAAAFLSTVGKVARRCSAQLVCTCGRVPTGARSLHVSRQARQDHRIDELFTCNEAWRKNVIEKDADFFKRQANIQQPRYLWIGCSDSRVATETICGLPPGSLFVHRNIGNMVNNIDVSAMSVLQYAVGVLKVQHIVVCGHYDCGAMHAAVNNVDLPSPLANWLRNVRDVYRMHREELAGIQDKDVRSRRLVEINVVEQAINLYKTRIVQQRRVETYTNIEEFGFVQPKIHPCVYDPGSGRLERMDVEMQDYLSELKDIYNLYTVDADEEEELGWDGMGPSVVLP